MCTFCGKDHNKTPTTKTIKVYAKNNKYLGSFQVPFHWSVRRYQQGLWRTYPDWYETKSS